MNIQQDNDHDPELGRLFAEARSALPAADFVAAVMARLARARRRRRFGYCAALAVGLAALVVLAPLLIDGSLAVSAVVSEQFVVGRVIDGTIVWIVSLLVGGSVLLWTRRGLQR